MRTSARRVKLITLSIAGALGFGGATTIASGQTTDLRVDEALQNIAAIARQGRIGYATIWDGNKYIQCRRTSIKEFRCEAAGASMQPSLRSVLTGERLNRLTALGWVLNASFGNYVQTFSAETPTGKIATRVLQTLTEAYDADVSGLEIQTAWVVDIPCPPRAGPGQNLAGSVNDSPSMRATSIRDCSYAPSTSTPQTVTSAAELISLYGAMATAEIQRIRINAARRVYVVFDAGIGYVQCAPEGPSTAIYCEAQSAESWPALSAVLTSERVARLHTAGYADPGRAPNYSRSYPLDKFNDAAIAREILTILHEVYGYTGATKLDVKTE